MVFLECVTGGSGTTRRRIHPTVTVENWTYGEEPSEPVIEGNKGKGKVELQYCVREPEPEPVPNDDESLETASTTAKNDEEEEVEWLAWPPVEAGTYTLRASIAQTAHYYKGEATCDFEVYKATPELGEITATVAHGEIDPAKVVFTRTNEEVPGDFLLKVNGLTLGVNDYDFIFAPEDNKNYAEVEGIVTIDVQPLWQGWKLIDGQWYHYKDDEPSTGWYWSNSYKSWYWLGDDGAMRTGWQFIDGQWYLFNDDGQMLSGWQWSAEYSGWFFFSTGNPGPFGSMLRDTRTPDGAYVGPDGRWVA